jgi:hypothetical protein
VLLQLGVGSHSSVPFLYVVELGLWLPSRRSGRIGACMFSW